MSLQVEKLENNMAKLTIEASADELEKAIQGAYLKNRGKFNIPGFRKGKTPRPMIEKLYGIGVFYEDAANAIIPDAYAKAAEETDLEIVSQPSIDVVQIEKGKPFIFTAEVALKPEVTLGAYKGVEIEKISVDVAEEEINAEIEKERENNARLVTVSDRNTVQDGDLTSINFEGFVDGVAFEGGKGEDYQLEIGSHSFIDTFEDQLIGAEVGVEKEVNVTFPEAYHAPELAGKPALFKVTVNEIKAKEMPEVDDEFAKDVSDFETLEEYKADIKAKLVEKKEKEAAGKKEDAVIEKIITNATMDIPAAMIDTQVNRMAEDFAHRIQQQGLSIEQYFQFTGMNADAFLAQMRPQAEKRIQSRLVLEAVAKAENIEISEEAMENEIASMAENYKMEVEKLKEFIRDAELEQIKEDLAIQEAVKLVVDAAVEA